MDPGPASPRRRLYPALLLMAVITVGCASVPKTSPELDIAAKSFTPSAGKARIYIVRPKAFKGAAMKLNAVLDGRELGSVSNGTYLMTEVDPGPHTLGSKTLENTLQDTIATVAGQSYFFLIKPRWGVIVARVGLEPITEGEGRAEVNKAKRAASAF